MDQVRLLCSLTVQLCGPLEIIMQLTPCCTTHPWRVRHLSKCQFCIMFVACLHRWFPREVHQLAHPGVILSFRNKRSFDRGMKNKGLCFLCNFACAFVYTLDESTATILGFGLFADLENALPAANEILVLYRPVRRTWHQVVHLKFAKRFKSHQQVFHPEQQFVFLRISRMK